MKLATNQFAIMLLAGVFGLTACNNDDEGDGPSEMNINTITTSDGTDLYGPTNAVNVALDQSVIITFNSEVNNSSLGDVGLWNGDDEVEADVSASGSTVTINPDENLFGGTEYTVQINGVQSTDGATASNESVTFTTEGIGLGTAPQSNEQTTYLQLNGNYVDVLGNASNTFAQNSWIEDRFGNAEGALYLGGANSGPGTGDVVEFSGDFIYPSITISTWMLVDPSDFSGSRPMFGVAAEKGYFLEIGGNIDWMKFTSSHLVDPDPMNHIYAASNTDPNGDGLVDGETIDDYFGSISELVTSNWAHFVVTYDASTSYKTIYINGVLVMQQDLNLLEDEYQMTDLALKDQDGAGPIENIDTKLSLGFFGSMENGPFDEWQNYSLAENTFIGGIDDFRIWDIALTQAQVQDLYNAEQ